ncbi:MAG TPA: D-amino-acid transaminase [Longimicrobiaceae bacterium]|nr:D-amino-acid transaminase [Longimicrobiaceae bacterium]
MTVYLNGDYLARADAKVSVDDRGFIFGDGVYEVVRALDGSFFTWDEHLDRMDRGMRELGFRTDSIPRRQALLEVAERLLHENDLLTGDATVYLQITRGAARRTHYYPPAETPVTVYLSASRFVPPLELRGVGADAITHPDLRWSRCDLKTVNLLPNVMAKQKAVESGAIEAILVRDGAITEGASTNVYGVVDGEIRTYPATNFILPGITRAVVLELAGDLGIPVREEPIMLSELSNVDEIFLSGTTTDILPIVRVDDKAVGTGKPGPVAIKLREALAKRMESTAGAGAR